MKIEGNIQVEQILTAFPVRMKTGIFSSESYHLVLTNKRFIFAVFDAEMFKKKVFDSTKEAKEEGKRIWGRLYSSIVTGATYYQRYLVIKPDEILNENNDNFYCDHALIHHIELKKYHNAYHSNDKYKEQEAASIIIKTSDLSYKIFVDNQEVLTELRSYLTNIFTHKFKDRY